MAFANRIGNLLKKSITPSPSLYQAILCMSSSKVFVGGLSYGTDDQSLRETFTNFGEVVEARVIMDRETGRSRGFGFVTFTSNEEASAAISGMDEKDLHGRMVRVNYAAERTGGYRGGFHGGGGSVYGNGGGSYNGSSGYGGDNYCSGGRCGGGGYGDGGSNNYGHSYNTMLVVGMIILVLVVITAMPMVVVAIVMVATMLDYGGGAYGGSESTGSSFNNNGGYGNNNQYGFKDNDDEPKQYAHRRG
ncbi:hypothetical protein OPV22_017893 [Ensete ventricosum]|uniref:RRM domain-containing protein n=1 Tax=Ensete ventricosum TaxID=4639 RepID=A0AAV8QXE8_ENSVE|nr:hypothetical protein OPV22_017893 [Ensete ventricosum]